MEQLHKQFSFDDIWRLAPTDNQELSFFPEDGLTIIGQVSLFELAALGEPFSFKHDVVVLIVKGEAEVTINLRDYHIAKGTLVVCPKGSIFQLNSHIGDVIMTGYNSLFSDIEQDSYNETIVDLLEDKERIVRDNFKLLWNIVKSGLYNRDVLITYITASRKLIGVICKRYSSISNQSISRIENIFSQFISLVNTYYATQHELSFYADKLCVTVNYLCVICKKISNVSAKEWIDRAITTNAQVMLRYSDKTVAEITYILHFPHVSTFCKFFKRRLGVTPSDYRNIRIQGSEKS